MLKMLETTISYYNCRFLAPVLPPGRASDESFLIVFEVLTEMRILSGLLLATVVVIVLLVVFEAFKSFRRKTH